MRTRRVRGLSTLLLLASFAAPLAYARSAGAQDTTATTPPKKKKKPKKKPAQPATTDVEATTPAPAAEPPPPPPPAAEPAPTPAPEPEKPAPKTEEEAPKLPAPQSTQYIGIRYRGNIVPKFMVNLFVDEGTGLYSNQIGVEYEIRRDNHSIIPWITFANYGFGDTLFLQKGKPQMEQYYSDINSSMDALYLGVDLLWRKPLAEKLELEYGLDLGLGFVFGSLGDNWVHADPNGSLIAANGARYSACATTSTSPTDPNWGCNPANHQNATTYKVGGFQDSSWFGGGPKPILFPYVSPTIGLRIPVAPQVALRAYIGFGLTGPFFGLGGSYGIH